MNRNCYYIVLLTILVPLIINQSGCRRISLEYENELLQIEEFDQLERKLGQPVSVYTNYPPNIGRHLITEKEMKNGNQIVVFLIKKLPSTVLVAKYEVETGKIIESEVYYP